MLTRRFIETIAMAIIGDSVLCMLSPQRHTSLWLSGPRWWKRAWAPFVQYPGLTRALGAVGLGFGVWLAWKQEPRITEISVENGLKHRWAGRSAEALR